MKRLIALLALVSFLLTGCLSLNSLISPPKEPKVKLKGEKVKEKGDDTTNSDAAPKAPRTKQKSKP